MSRTKGKKTVIHELHLAPLGRSLSRTARFLVTKPTELTQLLSKPKNSNRLYKCSFNFQVQDNNV